MDKDATNDISISRISRNFIRILTSRHIVSPGHYVNVENHRAASNRRYEMGERETICWPAEAAVLVE